MHDNSDDEVLIALLGVVLTVVVFALFFISTHEDNMYISSLHWSREVIEYYETSRTVCESRMVNDNTSISCHQKTDETITNRWKSSGKYPKEPKWPEYVISPKRKKRTNETYRISFSDGKDNYDYYTNFSQYKAFKPEEVYYVKINIFSVVFAVEKKRSGK